MHLCGYFLLLYFLTLEKGVVCQKMTEALWIILGSLSPEVANPTVLQLGHTVFNTIKLCLFSWWMKRSSEGSFFQFKLPRKYSTVICHNHFDKDVGLVVPSLETSDVSDGLLDIKNTLKIQKNIEVKFIRGTLDLHHNPTTHERMLNNQCKCWAHHQQQDHWVSSKANMITTN